MIITMIFGFMGGYEWVIAGLAILLLFGGRKIPELMKGMGKGIKEFKNATKEGEEEPKEIEDEKK